MYLASMKMKYLIIILYNEISTNPIIRKHFNTDFFLILVCYATLEDTIFVYF